MNILLSLASGQTILIQHNSLTFQKWDFWLKNWYIEWNLVISLIFLFEAWDFSHSSRTNFQFQSSEWFAFNCYLK